MPIHLDPTKPSKKDATRLRIGVFGVLFVILVLYIVVFPHGEDDAHTRQEHNAHSHAEHDHDAEIGVFGKGTINHTDTPKPTEATKSPTATKAILHTEYGDIVFLMDHDAAPRTVENFLKMATDGLFNNSCFYRYEPGFVLQGGLHCMSNQRSAPKSVPLEYKRPNAKMTVGLARTANPNSGSSEFFINLNDNSQNLGKNNGGGYAVFASVESGEEAMKKMMALKTVKQGLTMFVAPQPKILWIEVAHE